MPELMDLKDQPLACALALRHAKGIGQAIAENLLAYFGSLPSIFASSGHELARAGCKPSQVKSIQDIDWDIIQKDLVWADDPGNHIIDFIDPKYPRVLRETGACPLVLFAKGDLGLLQGPKLAIVGTRNPSASGKELANNFAQYLAQSGITVVSGLALGIDTASHEGAVNEIGSTIAVTGTGLDKVYPASNRKLAHKIAQKGLLLSEFSPGEAAKAENFPRRNRIIAGLSMGTLVVEAAVKSGSLITAKFAREYNREVFAIPGSVHNPLAKGCHHLIRQGAKLVEQAKDIFEEYPNMLADIESEDLSASRVNQSQRHKQGQESSSDSADVDMENSDNDGSIFSGIKSKSESNAGVKDLNNEHESGDKGVKVTLGDEYKTLLSHMEFDPLPIDDLVERSGMPAHELSSMLLILELEGSIVLEPGGYCKTAKATTGLS